LAWIRNHFRGFPDRFFVAMKSFAIFANIIQLLIILYLFVVQGLTMGLMVIFALFLFMIIPFINFLALLFADHPKDPSRPNRQKSSKGRRKLVKRQALRVVYPVERKAVLRIKDKPYEVVDVSEGGLRFLLGQEEVTRRKVTGQLSLLQGEILEVKGQLEKRQGRQAALLLKELIPYFTLSREKAYVDRMVRHAPKVMP
jgi:hypothetical protein